MVPTPTGTGIRKCKSLRNNCKAIYEGRYLYGARVLKRLCVLVCYSYFNTDTKELLWLILTS